MVKEARTDRYGSLTIPSWAGEQLSLRRTLEDWITEQVDLYEREGFNGLFGDMSGHDLEEAGGYTRSFVSAYCLNGDQRIVRFLKKFRDEWYQAVTESGQFYHGYDANEEGDYITHSSESFTQFLLNVLYLDISDEKTISMVEDAAEHLGNWNPDVQDWYDWDEHAFLSYYLGNRSPYHKPPYNFQTSRHFRVLAIASAAYEATGKERYLDLCRDYWSSWADWILNKSEDEDIPFLFNIIGEEGIRRYAAQKEIMDDWRFHRYYHKELEELGFETKIGTNYTNSDPIEDKPAWKAGNGFQDKHLPHDLVMTMLDVMRFMPDEPTLGPGLKRVMQWWIAQGPDGLNQLAAIEPHCGVHLPKYRDITGDSSLREDYLKNWPISPCSYLLTGDVNRLTGVAAEAESAFRRALARNSGVFGSEFVVTHACNVVSTAGSSSAYVMPALFSPALGGLGVHFGRAPWLNVLYYSDGDLGLPSDMAALYVPPGDDASPKAKLANCGDRPEKVAVRRIDPVSTSGLVLTAPRPDGLKEVTVNPGEVIELYLANGGS